MMGLFIAQLILPIDHKFLQHRYRFL